MRSVTLLLLATHGCATEAPFDLPYELPPGFPAPIFPSGNAPTLAKIALGRRLFFDTGLSLNRSQSCATCHEPERAFTDGKAHAVGSTGEQHPRGSMSLDNVAYATDFTWLDRGVRSLEKQAELPLFGTDVIELGWPTPEDLEIRVRTTGGYIEAFADAFGDERVSSDRITAALASYERTLLAGDSLYDRMKRRDLPEAIAEGEQLFRSERLHCARCHGGFTFANAESEGDVVDRTVFEDNGLGRFKTPSLRNIALTAPYMHDGRFATLDDVIDFYARGGAPGSEPQSPDRSPLVSGFSLREDERASLKAFLGALSEVDPTHSEP